MTKQEFLERYNCEQTISSALSSAIKAAVQRNQLYAKGVNYAQKKSIRDFWQERLQALILRYERPRTVVEYEADILQLQASLQKRFPRDLDYRISHAQKSLGVFLKHLWCMGKIVTPPSCPVDRIILQAAGAGYPDTNWGYVNSIVEHRGKVSILMAAKNKQAPNLTLAEWELAAFN